MWIQRRRHKTIQNTSITHTPIQSLWGSSEIKRLTMRKKDNFCELHRILRLLLIFHHRWFFIVNNVWNVSFQSDAFERKRGGERFPCLQIKLFSTRKLCRQNSFIEFCYRLKKESFKICWFFEGFSYLSTDLLSKWTPDENGSEKLFNEISFNRKNSSFLTLPTFRFSSLVWNCAKNYKI